MDDIIRLVVEQFPTFTGLAVLAFVLWRQNNRLMDAFFTQLDDLNDRLTAIEKRLPASSAEQDRR